MGRRLNRPDVADAYNLGLELEQSGDVEGAAAAYARYLELDPQDHGGVAVRLAALKRGATPAKAPESYVEVLFDQHADAFEDILVRQLGYGVPGLMRQMLDRLNPAPFNRMLDLGCGTGLAAEAMTGRVTEVIGVDLSSRMLDVCEDKDIYDGLYCADVEEFLADNDELAFDLISACDVLPYLGDLQPLIAGAAANLDENGLVAFSSEMLADGEGDYRVAIHQRFQHGLPYIKRVLGENGFTLLAADPINVRNQEGQPTPGHLVVAQKCHASHRPI